MVVTVHISNIRFKFYLNKFFYIVTNFKIFQYIAGYVRDDNTGEYPIFKDESKARRLPIFNDLWISNKFKLIKKLPLFKTNRWCKIMEKRKFKWFKIFFIYISRLVTENIHTCIEGAYELRFFYVK